MTNRGGDDAPDRPPVMFLLSFGAVAFVALLAAWIALAGQADVQDLVAGSVVAAAAIAWGFYISQHGRALPTLGRAEVRMLVALPIRIVAETGQVFVVAAQKLAGRDVPTGAWMTVAVVASSEAGGWRSARRDAVLTVLMSATPNTVVAEIDAESGTALVHQLVGTPNDPGSPYPTSPRGHTGGGT